MNIFLDTTLLFQDPFLKNNSNRLLINLVKRSKGIIWVSSVVLDEAREHLRKNIEKTNRELEKLTNDISKISKSKVELLSPIDIISAQNEFDNFFNELQNENLVYVVEPNNSHMPEIVHRAIIRKKPFAENRSEFRDAVIWLSYAELINSNNLTQNYFITNNVTDFYDINKVNIHPELVSDITLPIKMAKQANDVLIDFGDIIFEAVENEQLRLNLLNSNELVKEVHSEFSYIVQGYFEDFVYSRYYSQHVINGYYDNVELIMFLVKNIDKIELTKVDNDTFANGEMTFEIEIGLLNFNNNNSSIDRFTLKETFLSLVTVEFSLQLNDEETNERFEIINVKN